MHPLHETVEVYPALVGKGQAVVEGIHQVGLAPANTAPEVQAALGLQRQAAPALPPAAAGARAGQQTIVESLQEMHRVLLGRIVGESLPREIRLIALPGCQRRVCQGLLSNEG